MVHGRMIRPAVAGAVPVKVDESSIKDIPGAKVVWDKGFLGVVARQGMGRDPGRREAQGRVVEGRAAVPGPDRALRPHPQGAGAQARRSKARQTGNVDEAFKTAATRDRGRVRMAVPVARRDGTGLRAGRDQGRQGHLLDRLAEVALRAATASPPQLGMPRRRMFTSIWTRPGPAPTAATTPTMRRMDAARARQGGRQAGAPAIHARARHRLGPEGPGLDPPRPRGDRRPRQRHRLRVPQQGILARRRQHQRQQAVRHAGRPDPRRAR